MRMQMLQVQEYWQVKDDSDTKDINGVPIQLKREQVIYFVNHVFSKPHSGFLMTADGVPLTKTTDCNLTNEEIYGLAKKHWKK